MTFFLSRWLLKEDSNNQKFQLETRFLGSTAGVWEKIVES